ncbi:MAG: substrate-binding domain-containing protein [Bryobacteraceae bacterium]
MLITPPLSEESPVLPPFFQDLRDRGFPVVLINRRLKPRIFHQVSADYAAGVKASIETLTSLAHRRVAYISGKPAVLPMASGFRTPCSDSVSIGALRFLLESGVQAPREVSLTSFVGIDATEFTHPSLSTVATPLYEIGQQAFLLLMELIQESHAKPRDVVLPARFIPRESIGVAPKRVAVPKAAAAGMIRSRG